MAKVYTLTKKENNNEVGGIKLIYKVKENDISKTIVFIKPFKTLYATSKGDCKKNEWGNTKSPYSNVWIQTEQDYNNISEINNIDFRMSLEQILPNSEENITLISRLNEELSKFVILSKEDKDNFTKETPTSNNTKKSILSIFKLTSLKPWKKTC